MKSIKGAFFDRLSSAVKSSLSQWAAAMKRANASSSAFLHDTSDVSQLSSVHCISICPIGAIEREADLTLFTDELLLSVRDQLDRPCRIIEE